MNYEDKERVKILLEENPEIRLLIAGNHFEELWEYVFSGVGDYGDLDDERTRKIANYLLIQALVEAGIDPKLTKIPDSAFCYTIFPEKVIIPEGVISIGYEAFMHSRGFKEIILPHSLKELGKSSFISSYQLESINIPDSITVIPEYCFGFCHSLEKVKLPSNLKEIGRKAFIDNPQLTEINLPGGLEIIGERAFDACFVKNLVIPNSVNEISDMAFYDMHNLESITLPKKFKGQVSRLGLRGKSNLINWV